MEVLRDELVAWAEAVGVFLAGAAGYSRRFWAGAGNEKLPRSSYGCAGPPQPAYRHANTTCVRQLERRISASRNKEAWQTIPQIYFPPRSCAPRVD
jgi:hypothetical protein